jgi:hypothetical protein
VGPAVDARPHVGRREVHSRIWLAAWGKPGFPHGPPPRLTRFPRGGYAGMNPAPPDSGLAQRRIRAASRCDACHRIRGPSPAAASSRVPERSLARAR